ncbi:MULTISPECIES: ATP-binding protein [Spirulina sp. CCY15215]|uniref:trifunctional serine/threonine-protein kinase/ATP-binding protein/sensor histidine kinase n=1 Tax=Spirulina sp. CCY15215 TaxID=2767591 RepID=UPI001951995E|nr:ATP-binding protein [Spirulina major]
MREIQKLAPSTQNVLQLAACIGNQFDLRMLAIVNEKSVTTTAKDLWDALQSSLIVPLNDTYKIPQAMEHSETLQIHYKFLHDRVQQAAYSLIPEAEKQQVHLQVGRLLRQSVSVEQLQDCLFDVVNPLNIGSALIKDPQERLDLARLNLQAGCKAKAAAAYDAALAYLTIGRDLLPEEGWDTEYNLTLQLYVETVEVEYLLARFEKAENLSDIVLDRAQNLLDRVKIYELKIQFLIPQNRMNEAIETALPVVELLGYPLEIEPTRLQLTRPLPQLQELANYPQMRDRQQLAALQILIIVTGPAYMARPDLLPFIVFRMVNLCLEFGHSSLAAYAYGMYGLMLCGPLQDILSGYQSGQISLNILEQYPSDALKCKINMLFNCFVGHWQEDHALTIDRLEKTVQMGMETGDMVYAAYCAMWSCGYMMLTGTKLQDAAQAQEIYIEFLTKTKQDHGLYPAKTWRQLTQNLQGKAPDPLTLQGDYLNREEIKSLEAQQNQMSLFFVYFAEVILAYVLKDWQTAGAKLPITAQYQAAATASMLSGGYLFYETLVHLALYGDLSPEEQEKTWEVIETNTKQITNWADLSPQNYQSKQELIWAERSRLQGNFLEAMDYYDRAIATARERGFWMEVAIASERTSEFYQSLGRSKIANQYLLDAVYHYNRLGVWAKVTALQDKDPTLLQQAQIVSANPTPITSTQNTQTNTGRFGEILDLNTVIKAAQTLSSEIVLSQLLSRLMSLAMENAGAQMGYLFLMEQEQFKIVASGQVDTTMTVTVWENQPFASTDLLPLSLIQYVQRTHEDVVLVNAAEEGMLYLENNLVAGAFTGDRLKILKILSTQAAISVNNAMLYHRLEDYSRNLEVKVEERTQELQKNNQTLQQTLQELRQTQTQLIQVEKMSSLGQMVAGIAHEINNPVSFISGNLTHARNYVASLVDLIELYEENISHPQAMIEEKREEIDFEFLCQDLDSLFASMKTGSDRIRQIVLGLRNFSRLDESDKKEVDLHEGLDNTLLLLQHRLGSRGKGPDIAIAKNYGDLPLVNCYASQLNQVFLNILTNAIDFLSVSDISDSPKVSIKTQVKDSRNIRICIADNGSGMSKNVRDRVFDPFFTTKPIGAGTGLGLSISYQIITQQHGGQLQCFSQPGEGAEFVIDIPIQ